MCESATRALHDVFRGPERPEEVPGEIGGRDEIALGAQNSEFRV